MFVPDGANLALSSKSLIFSSGIGSGLNFLILLRILITSLTSIHHSPPQTKANYNQTGVNKLQKAAHNQRHVKRAPVIIVCCADLKAFKEFPERVDELIASGALPERTREVFIPYIEKGMSTVTKDALMVAAAANIAIAVEHIVLQAVEIGLGTCWVRWYEDKEVKEILDIPDHIEVMALLPVGIPDEDPSPRPRLSLDKIVFSEKYGDKYT